MRTIEIGEVIRRPIIRTLSNSHRINPILQFGLSYGSRFGGAKTGDTWAVLPIVSASTTRDPAPLLIQPKEGILGHHPPQSWKSRSSGNPTLETTGATSMRMPLKKRLVRTSKSQVKIHLSWKQMIWHTCLSWLWTWQCNTIFKTFYKLLSTPWFHPTFLA